MDCGTQTSISICHMHIYIYICIYIYIYMLYIRMSRVWELRLAVRGLGARV